MLVTTFTAVFSTPVWLVQKEVGEFKRDSPLAGFPGIEVPSLMHSARVCVRAFC